MRLAVLFSGGKDSTYSLQKAMEKEEVACLISIVSKNKDSYMYHTPNISMTSLQAEAIGLPIIVRQTEGVKEDELSELEDAIKEAIGTYGIEGVVTGAIESVYQSSRVQAICHRLGIWCFNPLWKKDQEDLLEELIVAGYTIMITGVAAYPLEESWLGRIMDRKAQRELLSLSSTYGISPIGEGGEFETTVLDGPVFKRCIEIVSSSKQYRSYAGRLEISDAEVSDR